MSLFKCKMCGGDLEINEGATIAECEYCGTKQTVPKATDENLQNLFNRANTLRIKSEFDKAEKLYEKIIQADTTQSEAYWGLILCKYGIEYVDDPATFKKIPTCHRASYDSIIADDDYKSAIENADLSQRAIYEEQAKEIDRIQKDILALAQKEETYDVFICYKETDADGHRTQDSVIANDIYYQLKQEGFKVFYAAITLESKLGRDYEPIIFAALNSAKVMLSIGTKPEYFNAVWVKNEWSRFLKIIKKDRSKLLIPCYRDMDAYELPEEFAHLQAQDMAKIGFINDIVRGIKKVIRKDDFKKSTVIKESIPVSTNVSGNIAPLLERVFMFLEDGDWESADEYCEKVLDLNPKTAQAYLGKLMAELKIRRKEDILDYPEPFDDSNNYKKALRFADDSFKAILTGYIEHINTRNENARLESIYAQATKIMESATTKGEYIKSANIFETIRGYKDSDKQAEVCYERANAHVYKIASEMMADSKTEKEYKEAADLFATIVEYKDADSRMDECLNNAEGARKDAILENAKYRMVFASEFYCRNILKILEPIREWKDAEDVITACQKKMEELEAQAEAERIEKERLAIMALKKAETKRRCIKIIVSIILALICLAIAVSFLFNKVIIPNRKYNDAIALMDAGKYSEAISAFEALDGYRGSVNKIEECNINIYGEEVWNKVKSVNVGDVYKLGSYEQDNNKSNGQEDIEWLVLAKDGTKILVVSKYALDCKPYNTSYTDVTWETCTLRKWLNNDFINASFSADEKAMIPTVTVSADKNPNYSTNPGNATRDQVFLLSITEVNKYFSSDSARQCKPTDCAVANGAYVNSSNGNCWWRLRSPGDYQSFATIVNSGGGVSEDGFGVHDDRFAVRPALWIDLS